MKSASVRERKRLLLVGAGHAHLEVIRSFITHPDPELDLVLVNPGTQALYSGMLPGFVARQYRWDELVFDAEALAAAAGATFVNDFAVRILWAERKLELAAHPMLPYDALSLDIGSQTALPPMEEAARISPAFLATRPFTALGHALRHWDEQLESSAKSELLVIGSGAAGFELACALRARYPKARLRLLEGTQKVSALQRSALSSLEIELIRLGHLLWIAKQEKGFELRCEKGIVTCEFLLAATGAKAQPLVADSKLPEERGYLRVNEFLQCTSVPEIFGAGDCVQLESHPNLAKAGVFAVREAPFLARNLRSFLGGKPLESFRPQRFFLRLLNLSDGRAIAGWGPFQADGTWAWHWKDRIDRAFMKKYALPKEP